MELHPNWEESMPLKNPASKQYTQISDRNYVGPDEPRGPAAKLVSGP